eukprot:CAMPEP_0116144598 /NCGR_PEP_ID=MMETSP0329-20121206/16096_1 /TAXON_ID=697910 /ORGANISM="Pseudo-nitzschia arenysensis, Strain B593" /LENGTH=481 /DNA_ID=CAMNT_0003640049 /DNA_START=125 /DNA_END=1570 /DNA_ORIENTATION=-
METNIDLLDPVVEEINEAERQGFLCVCQESFDIIRFKNMNYTDWTVFVSLLLQMSFADLSRKEDFYDVLKRKVISNGCSEGSWCLNTNKDGRIDRLRLEPGILNTEIPPIIRRLDCLKVLNLTGQNVNCLHLKEISLLPQLQELKMVWKRESLMAIAHQIRSDDLPLVSKILRSVHFLRHEHWEENELDRDLQDPETKAALKTFLDFFITIDTVRFPDESAETSLPSSFAANSDWQHSLIKNNVGRRIIERGRVHDTGDESNIPLSVWPKILERAQKVTDERLNATGIYYLLREGPVLMEVRDLERNQVVSSSDDPPISIAELVDFTQDSINNVKNYLAHECNGRRLPNIHTTSPFADSNNQSEINTKQELNPPQTSYYQSQTRILRQIYELGRTDIYFELLKLESHLHSPRREHLEALFQVYSYLNIEKISVSDEPLSDDTSDTESDWIYDETKDRYVEDDVIRSELAFHRFIESTSSPS